MSEARAARVEIHDPVDVVYDSRLKVEVSIYGRDRGSPERWKHALLVEAGNGRGGERHARVLFPSPLDRYHRRGLLSGCQFPHKRAEENEQRYDAAVRFLAAWEQAGRQPRLTANIQASVHIDTVTHQQIGGFERWKAWGQAYIACGPQAAIVQAVVCFDEVASDYVRRKNRRLAHPERVGLERLRLGLAGLASWYAALDRGARRLAESA